MNVLKLYISLIPQKIDAKANYLMYQKLLYSPAASRCFKDLNVVRRETCRKIKGKKKYKKIHYQLHKQCKAYHFTPNVSNKTRTYTKQGGLDYGKRSPWQPSCCCFSPYIEPFSWEETQHRTIFNREKGCTQCESSHTRGGNGPWP